MTFVACVTGANKGIGKEIALKLCNWVQSKDSAVILVGSRDEARGQATVDELNKGIAKPVAKLVVLAVDDKASVAAAAKKVRDSYGPLDVLVCNAGWAAKRNQNPLEDPSVMKKTLETNYWGVRNCIEAFTLKKPSRVVSLSSLMSKTSYFKLADETKRRVREADTIEKIDALAKELQEATEAKTLLEKGWKDSAYGPSKLLVTRLMMVLGASVAPEETFYCSCHPGWCKSDMAGWTEPTSTAEEGARTPFWLATVEKLESDFQGSYFDDCKVDNYIH